MRELADQRKENEKSSKSIVELNNKIAKIQQENREMIEAEKKHGADEVHKMKDLADQYEHQLVIEKTKFNVTEQIHKETEKKMQA